MALACDLSHAAEEGQGSPVSLGLSLPPWVSASPAMNVAGKNPEVTFG